MIGNKEINVGLNITPRLIKDFRAAWFNYKRVKPIKRTRKRQIDKAKHMMDWHNHTSYEWPQWWHKKARKPKRWKND
ncbi:hypothetical protein [Limosilactobacillus vaginalis]|uniref:hypothetical protein n=1 Tax=Limosilactobacillus vaginalis TaxID=1633 RepID=UPI0022E1CC5C|nr:hypothetical protein [Limosilactobacillus vaginalis]